MAFFDLPSDAEMPPESARLLEEYRKLTGTAEVPRVHRTYGRLTPIVETRVRAALTERTSGTRRLPPDRRAQARSRMAASAASWSSPLLAKTVLP